MHDSPVAVIEQNRDIGARNVAGHDIGGTVAVEVADGDEVRALTRLEIRHGDEAESLRQEILRIWDPVSVAIACTDRSATDEKTADDQRQKPDEICLTENHTNLHSTDCCYF
jgi:hypothetical protein